jgi:hypothetical protein
MLLSYVLPDADVNDKTEMETGGNISQLFES